MKAIRLIPLITLFELFGFVFPDIIRYGVWGVTILLSIYHVFITNKANSIMPDNPLTFYFRGNNYLIHNWQGGVWGGIFLIVTIIFYTQHKYSIVEYKTYQNNYEVLSISMLIISFYALFMLKFSIRKN